jgi:WXXGXW repeat (2 copies)
MGIRRFKEMKKAIAMMILAAGALCAAPRISVGIGIGAPAPAVVIPASPGPGYTWVNGYYAPDGVWIAGYWAPPAVVVGPRVVVHPRGFDHRFEHFRR